MCDKIDEDLLMGALKKRTELYNAMMEKMSDLNEKLDKALDAADVIIKECKGIQKKYER